MKNKKWTLFNSNKVKITSILAGNILANIPKSAMPGIVYLIILQLATPILKNLPFNFAKLTNTYWMYVAAFVLYIIISIISQRNTFVKSYIIGTETRLLLGEKLRKLSLGFFKANDPGDVTARMLHDVNKAEENLSHHITDFISSIVSPVLIGSFLLFVNAKLAGILFGTVAVSFAFFFLAKHIIMVLGKKHLKAINLASSRILEYTNSIKILKSFNLTGSAFVKLDEAMINLKKLSFKSEVFAGIPVQIALFIMDIGFLGLLFYATKNCIAGLIDVQTLITFTVLSFAFFEPLKAVGISIVLLRHAKNSTDRIQEVLSTPEPEYVKNTTPPVKHSFEFKDVSFKYADNMVLKELSCKLPAKSMTALVGVSGSGKTTITNLLARFWDINSGDILYDSKNINDIEPDLLLKNISMVFQDVFLFNDTIANNIKIGKQNASMNEVINAAKQAECHDFISKLPNGYNTLVSEGGQSLSGGERQRISIARAILKDAPIILLDEATASLDPENESYIQKAIDNLVKNKTLIVIAHKFNSIINANQILVLQKGRIIEKGQHHELIKENGLYSKLWQAQQVAGSWKI